MRCNVCTQSSCVANGEAAGTQRQQSDSHYTELTLKFIDFVNSWVHVNKERLKSCASPSRH